MATPLTPGTTINAVSSASSTGTLTLSYALADHAHLGLVQAGVAGNTAGASTNLQGSLVLAGGNNVTLSATTAAGAMTVSINGPNISSSALTVSAAGNTSGATQTLSSGSVIFAGGNNITLSATTAAGAQTLTISAGSLVHSAAGNTSGATTTIGTGTLVFNGGNNITLSATTAAGAATITINGPNLSSSALTLSAAGNTAGATMTNSSGSVIFAGGNNITLSATTAAGGAQTISINGPNISSSALTVSVAGNTSGATQTQSSGSIVFAGGNNITLSATTAAGAMTVTVSAGSLVHSLSGNSSGASQLLGTGTLVLAGGNNITLSATTAAGAMTVTVSGPVVDRTFNQTMFPVLPGVAFVSTVVSESISFSASRAVGALLGTQATSSTSVSRGGGAASTGPISFSPLEVNNNVSVSAISVVRQGSLSYGVTASFSAMSATVSDNEFFANTYTFGVYSATASTATSASLLASWTAVLDDAVNYTWSSSATSAVIGTFVISSSFASAITNLKTATTPLLTLQSSNCYVIAVQPKHLAGANVSISEAGTATSAAAITYGFTNSGSNGLVCGIYNPIFYDPGVLLTTSGVVSHIGSLPQIYGTQASTAALPATIASSAFATNFGVSTFVPLMYLNG